VIIFRRGVGYCSHKKYHRHLPTGKASVFALYWRGVDCKFKPKFMDFFWLKQVLSKIFD